MQEVNATLELYANFFVQQPVPSWIKLINVETKEVNMYRVNDAYHEVIGILPESYKMRPDSAIWDKSTSEAFLAHDLKAILTPGTETFEESWECPKTKEYLTGRFVLKKELLVDDCLKSIFGPEADNTRLVIGQITGIVNSKGEVVWPKLSKDV